MKYRNERDGEVWEASAILYTRFRGEPCMQIDMRGNPDTYFLAETVIIEACDLGDDVARYWYHIPAFQNHIQRMVKSYEALQKIYAKEDDDAD